MRPSIGRYVEQHHLSGKPIPPTAEEEAAKKAREERLALRTKDTGIIVHVMSKYMGQRVHVKDTAEARRFALAAHAFHVSYKRVYADAAAADVMSSHVQRLQDEGGRPLDEATTRLSILERDQEHLAELQSQLDMLAASLGKIASHAPKCDAPAPAYRDLSNVDLADAANAVTKAREAVIPQVQAVDDAFRGVLHGRREYREALHLLFMVTWQSLCTTILSRRVRVEEDLDDGTYTTVKKIQLASEFKRLGIMEEEDRDQQIQEISEVLKLRIRDLKRIFAFYAAAGKEGSATSMDNGEWWKFVKDSKIQKDRTKLPSSRVDLIFQACNMDYSKTGKERLAADDGEADPTEWVEGLVRLALYRYDKGAPSKRLDKMMNDEVLPNACSVDTDVFRERMANEKVVGVFQKHKRNLKAIYKVYAADDQSDNAVAQMDSMNANELVAYGTDMKLIGPLFSQRAVRTIFAYVQREEELLEEDEEDKGDVAETEMVYQEFTECNGGITCWFKPDPYCVTEIRIDHFLIEQILPTAKSLVRFKGKLGAIPSIDNSA